MIKSKEVTSESITAPALATLVASVTSADASIAFNLLWSAFVKSLVVNPPSPTDASCELFANFIQLPPCAKYPAPVPWTWANIPWYVEADGKSPSLEYILEYNTLPVVVILLLPIFKALAWTAVVISEFVWSAVADASIPFNLLWSASVNVFESLAASTAALTCELLNWVFTFEPEIIAGVTLLIKSKEVTSESIKAPAAVTLVASVTSALDSIPSNLLWWVVLITPAIVPVASPITTLSPSDELIVIWAAAVVLLKLVGTLVFFAVFAVTAEFAATSVSKSELSNNWFTVICFSVPPSDKINLSTPAFTVMPVPSAKDSIFIEPAGTFVKFEPSP